MASFDENILQLLRQRDGKALPLRDIVARLGCDRSEQRIIKETLERLVAAGQLRRWPGNRYGAGKEQRELPKGLLFPHPEGYGFVRFAEGEDVFIPARYMAGGMPGDQVEVEVSSSPRTGRREGRVVRIIERAVTRVVGRIELGRKAGRLVPDDQRLTRDIIIPIAGLGGAIEGQVVVVELTAYPDDRNPALGKVVEILGWPDDPEVEQRIIIEKYGLPVQFTERCLVEARRIPLALTEQDFAGREDLRQLTVVTIDGETAKDFDDAVAVRREGELIRLWVSIADVAHYVRPGSSIDQDAYLRGTSVYFPGRCLPMLPEELSNGICSLNPAVDRLTMTAEMLFDRNGGMIESRYYPSVIRSVARLTYTLVRQIVVDQDLEQRTTHAALIGDLEKMAELAGWLTAKRQRRGSIDFDLPEAEILLNLQGETAAIVRSERNLAHRLIEEFMLAANEAVADFVTAKNLPFLYRIHEPPSPEKLLAFQQVVQLLGHSLTILDERVLPADLQQLVAAVAGRPEERLVNEMLLRCMKQAKYSETNVGHFGLASACYTHFTSPIRRYPDLVVHRILKGVISGKLTVADTERWTASLPQTAEHTSRRERLAMEAEREIVQLKKLQFMQEKVGEEFDGVISSVSAYGLYVELSDFFVEGLVHISTLTDDIYQFIEEHYALVGNRSQHVFRIGDQVQVRVAGVNMNRRQLDFSLLDHQPLAVTLPIRHLVREEYLREPVRGKRPPGLRAGSANKGQSRPGERGGAKKPAVGPGTKGKGRSGKKSGGGKRPRR